MDSGGVLPLFSSPVGQYSYPYWSYPYPSSFILLSSYSTLNHTYTSTL